MDLLTVLIIAVLLGLIPAAIAQKDFVVWWLFGAALFIVALPAAILLKPDVAEIERQQLEEESMKRCPYCAELVKREAKVCKHCGRDLTVPPQPDDAPNLGHPEVAIQPRRQAMPPEAHTGVVIDRTVEAQPLTADQDSPQVRARTASPVITDVDKLIAFGQMALEQGWYDQARDHFEQALALDATNREAMKGLARVNEILNLRMATTAKPMETEIEPAKPVGKREQQATGKKIIKRRWQLFVLIIVLLGLGFGVLKLGWSAFQVYRARQALDAYGEQTQPLLNEFVDAVDRASVSDMQRIQREFEKIEPPPVAEEAHKYFCEGIDYVIRSFLALGAKEHDWTVGRLVGHGLDAFNYGYTAIRKVREELEQWPRSLLPGLRAVAVSPVPTQVDYARVYETQVAQRESTPAAEATPTPRPGPLTPTLSRWGYLLAVAEILDTYSSVCNSLADLFDQIPQNPSTPEYKNWQLDVANTLSLLRLCGEEIRGLQPPSEFVLLHKDLVQMAVHFDHAIDLGAFHLS
jgi:hypothetical protein